VRYDMQEVIYMTTGERIKAARKKAGLTQAELASKLEIPFQSISQWERDIRKPKKETIAKIARALNVHPVELSGDIFNEALLSVLQGDYKSVEEFRAAFLSNKIAFARLYDDTDKRLIQFYDMLNDLGREKAVDYVFELSQQSQYLKEIYTKAPAELKKLQEDSAPPPYPKDGTPQD